MNYPPKYYPNYNNSGTNPNIIPMMQAKPHNLNNNNNNYNSNQQGQNNNNQNYNSNQAYNTQPYQQQQHQQQYQQQQQFGAPGLAQTNPNHMNYQQQQLNSLPQQQQQQPQGYNPQVNQNSKNTNGIMNNNLNQGQPLFQIGYQAANMEHQKQLEQLHTRYKFQLQSNTSNTKAIVLLDLEIPNVKIPIRIEFGQDFPRSKPEIFLRSHMIQQNVNDKTWRVLFDSFIRWETLSVQPTALLNLILAVNQVFQQYPPQPDHLLLKINDMKGSVNEQVEWQKLRELEKKSVFPELNQEKQYQDLLSSASFAKQIEATPAISSLRKRVGEFADLNLKLSSDLIEQQAKLDIKKSALIKLNQQLEEQKVLLQQSFQAQNSIQERFSNMSVIQALGEKIDELDESSSKIKSSSFEDDIRRYKETRTKFHVLSKKREKLMSSI